jgi:hypothetical protein
VSRNVIFRISEPKSAGVTCPAMVPVLALADQCWSLRPPVVAACVDNSAAPDRNRPSLDAS